MQAMEEIQVCNILELKNWISKMEMQLNCLTGAPAQRSATTITVAASPGQRGQMEEVEACGGREDVEAAWSQQPAQLRSNPKLFQTPWDEHIQGIGGNKPTKEFTREE